MAQVAPEDHFQYIIQRASEESKQSIVFDIEQATPDRRGFGWLKYAVAASVVGLVSFMVYFVNLPKMEEESIQLASQENEIVAKKGTKSKLLLPDGSQVWLNSDTKLVYKSDFNDSLREVSLEGEAYFDVVKIQKSL